MSMRICITVSIFLLTTPGLVHAAPLLEDTFNPETDVSAVIRATEDPEAFGQTILAVPNVFVDVLQLQIEAAAPARVLPGPASLELIDADVIGGEHIRPDVAGIIPREALAAFAVLAHVAANDAARGVFSVEDTYPAHRRLLSVDGEIITESVVENELVVSDTARGTTVSGICDDAYAVLRLYSDKDAYLREPESYLFTLSEPCTTGAFEYAFSDMPESLGSGTYYLIAGDGDDYGEWLPSSALAEIAIR